MSYKSFTIDSISDATPSVILPPGGCVAHFRPREDWNGSEFGFDWIRIGDSGLPADNLKYYDHYAYLMGKYYNNARNLANDANSWEFMSDGVTPVNFENDLPQFNKYICEYFEDQLLLPWMFNESRDILPLAGTNLPHITTPILDEVYYTRINYYTPIMTLLKGRTATLNLFIKSQLDKQEPKRIELKEKDNTKSHFTLPDPIPFSISVKNYEISIGCIESFTEDKFIEAYAIFDNGNGKEEEKLCGRLKVLANNEIIPYHLFYIQVEYLSGTSIASGAPLAGELDTNSKYLNQAMMKISANTKSIKLTVSANTQKIIDTALYTFAGKKIFHPNRIQNDLYDSLDADFDEYLKKNLEDPKLYKEYRKIFFFENPCYIIESGMKAQTNGKTNGRKNAVLLFGQRDVNTDAHEILHTLDLQHSFTSEGQDYSFMAQRTENLMDYSHFGSRIVPKVSTWKWQWDKMRATASNLNRIIQMRWDASPEGQASKEISDRLTKMLNKKLDNKK